MDFAKFLDAPPPGDTTLDQVYVLMTEGRIFQDLARDIGRDLRLRFMRRSDTGLVTRDEELPGSTTLDDFRALCELRLAYISIDDQSGGLRLPEPAPAPTHGEPPCIRELT